MKNIEHFVSESKKSPLLNKSTSSTPRDGDKESKSSSTVKKSAEESTSTQKQIEDVYRSTEKEVFGRDNDREDISRMLRERPDTNAGSSSTSKPYSVIGIHGVTGSGKSTLAQYVCDYEKKAAYFDPIMFIQVGTKFNVGNIFRDMLEQITKSRPPNNEDLRSMKTMLEETLKDKCFLLVLDDLWVNDENQKELYILDGMLRRTAALSGSRVLVTAQKTDAAATFDAHLQPFSIPDLEEKVYLSLLMHHAGPFATDDDYRKYEEIGSKIAIRLHSSPIAAVTVGKQLRRNKSIKFWETTANLELLNKTMGALWWSYQLLGADIRRCFAYCSTFPRGYWFDQDDLVRIWIAQGFVNTGSDTREEPEDVGQRYFDELLTFSFLQAEWEYSDMRFRIHDLLHELAERVSGSEFYRIGLNDLPKDIPRGVHHLFIQSNNVADIVQKILDLGNLRTLIIKGKHYADRVGNMERDHDLENFLGPLFMRLSKVRVLIIELNCSICNISVPVSVYQMKHLRYLRFTASSCCLIFPSTFSKLYHIQVLDLVSLDPSYPEDMANLICMRHISGRLSCLIPNFGRLTSLQALTLFEVKEGQGYGLKQLKHLNKLRGTLNISGLEIVGSKEEALEANLTNKVGLRSLKLFFGWDRRFRPDVQVEVLEGLLPSKGSSKTSYHEILGFNVS